MLVLKRDNDPGDDSDPCGDDVCSITPGSSHASAGSQTGTSRSSTRTLSDIPTPSASGGGHGGGGDHNGGGNRGTGNQEQGKGFNKSAIGGIVIGILALILMLVALYFWYKRRREQRTVLGVKSAGTPDSSTGDMRLLPENAAASLPPPSHTQSDLVAAPLLVSQGHSHLTKNANSGHFNAQHVRSASETALPNPYDSVHTSPQLHVHHSDPLSELPALPTHDDTLVGLNTEMLSLSRTSHPPSAWRESAASHEMYSDITSRVSSMVSSSSSGVYPEETALLDEMTSYQKRLESHHQKDSEDAVAVAAAVTGDPVDPPPVYSPTEEREERLGSPVEHSGQQSGIPLSAFST